MCICDGIQYVYQNAFQKLPDLSSKNNKLFWRNSLLNKRFWIAKSASLMTRICVSMCKNHERFEQNLSWKFASRLLIVILSSKLSRKRFIGGINIMNFGN